MRATVLVVALLGIAVVGFVGYRTTQGIDKQNCLQAAALRYPVEYGVATPSDFTGQFGGYASPSMVTGHNDDQRTEAVEAC